MNETRKHITRREARIEAIGRIISIASVWKENGGLDEDFHDQTHTERSLRYLDEEYEAVLQSLMRRLKRLESK